MNLYIWSDPYKVSYGSSLLVVVAGSLRQAKEIAKKSPAYQYGDMGNPSNPNQTELGDPTRIIPVPCGEWHQWSE